MSSAIFEIELDRAAKIIESGILSDTRHLLCRSALIEVLIIVNYCLQVLNKLGKRIDFRDDVGAGDITDLINRVRNGACHSTSDLNRVGTNAITYGVVEGRVPRAFNINGTILGSDYEDEIAYIYGPNRVYLKRHILRVLKEINQLIRSEPDLLKTFD